MLKLALMGLVIVAVAGILATAIFIMAKAIGTLFLIALFICALYWVLKLALKALRTKGAPSSKG